MGDSGDSSSASDCRSPQPKGRSTNKVFIWLKEKAKCTPRGNPWVLLNRGGRVKDVAIGGNYSSAKMKELVKENFAGLAAVDLNRKGGLSIYQQIYGNSRLFIVSNRERLEQEHSL
ncbi:unnamed protein product [Pocillopora meandrina]|uniref:Uncharacterized protein n=1 Tax=Pocillopora meandrina TaxID=46732 RepID=A0AAU9VLU1_9CNID|nr:unnamed protein product [Pocillopora meandrina]